MLEERDGGANVGYISAGFFAGNPFPDVVLILH
jgi:hypothetical protein